MTTPTTQEPAPEREIARQRHVHVPHRVGLPPLPPPPPQDPPPGREPARRRPAPVPPGVGPPPLLPYARQLWQRREFAVELARTKLRAQHFNTAFGQFWLLLNPVLLAGVYF